MKKTGKISVAVVEDELCTRVGLLTLLSGWPVGRVLFEAADGVDFEEQCARHGVPDLVLVDFKLPRRDGLQLLAWMKER
ncbi:MAG: response regulator, partial [Flavobacteriales bacterium]|nr:response regulator [Flavobacteriales bacterium]